MCLPISQDSDNRKELPQLKLKVINGFRLFLRIWLSGDPKLFSSTFLYITCILDTFTYLYFSNVHNKFTVHILL